MKEKMFAVYSEKQRKLVGLVEWSRPDGSIVQATSVGQSRNAGCVWDDTIELGEVVQFLRRVERPTRMMIVP